MLTLRYKSDGSGLEYLAINNLSAPLDDRLTLFDAINIGTAYTTEMFTTMRVIAAGPRILRADAWNDELNDPQRSFELLEEVNLNLMVGDYKQPFPTMVVELPTGYCKRRTLPCPQAGEETLLGYEKHGVYPDKHQPCFVTVDHIPELGLLNCAVTFDSEQSIKVCFHGKDQMDLETTLRKLTTREREYDDSMDISDDEYIMTARVIRAVLNGLLIAEEVGVDDGERENPSYYKRMERWLGLAKKNKNQEKVLELTRGLRQMPIYYKLKTVPKLYVIEQRDDNHGKQGGWTVTPHRRKAFYKMQHYGPGNTLRKRIRIPAVFVNEHLLYN